VAAEPWVWVPLWVGALRSAAAFWAGAVWAHTNNAMAGFLVGAIRCKHASVQQQPATNCQQPGLVRGPCSGVPVRHPGRYQSYSRAQGLPGRCSDGSCACSRAHCSSMGTAHPFKAAQRPTRKVCAAACLPASFPQPPAPTCH